MTTISTMTLSSPTRVIAKGVQTPLKTQTIKCSPIFKLNKRWPGLIGSGRSSSIQPVRAAPDKISEKVEKSIKDAEETCTDNPTSNECAAAWDEVEELSAAASHARDKKKDSDPLENYCKDNPETDECRTYDN
ncbi:calvin cycle protein CP12-1, chloroplastic [Arachis duranensis]|uniref:Calvin cycle protein CP12-1, chloroplastic n=1 Tax=Arachis duranensis TaxID=130453 RepID=A0A6P4DAV3_ARADU|nr:calvin cycle protein CP12-1, chloroplastic [Arachis duranensis]